MNSVQKSGKIQLPEGKKVAVSLTFDFDAQSLWMGIDRTFPVSMSRGEYGAVVGVPRILDTLKKYDIKSTFFIPGHTADTFPDICKEIIKEGHEIGYHGYAHVSNSTMDYEEEDKTMLMGLEALKRLGIKPVGYRSPSCDFSSNTMDLIIKHGFKYSSNLLGNDMYPYYPRTVKGHTDQGNTFESPSTVLELPLSWHLDDIPFIEYVDKFPYMPQSILRPTSELFDRWTSIYEYTAEFDGGLVVLVCHPQATGHPEHIMNLERFIEYLIQNGAWLTNCESIVDAFIIE